MNLSRVKWAQWDKTQSRELSGLFICVCIALCTIVAHNIAQNRPDSFPSYPPDNHHCSDDVYLREGGHVMSQTPCFLTHKTGLCDMRNISDWVTVVHYRVHCCSTINELHSVRAHCASRCIVANLMVDVSLTCLQKMALIKRRNKKKTIVCVRSYFLLQKGTK